MNNYITHTIQVGDQTYRVAYIYLAETSSTNDVAKTITQPEESDAVFIRAGHQTHGRGRFDRTWTSQKGKDLLCSFVLFPAIPTSHASEITILTAHVIRDVLSRNFQLPCDIKPPNDVLCNNKKIAGILTEQESKGDHILRLIVGIGINTNSNDQELPKGATSIYNETKICTEISELVEQLWDNFFHMYTEFIKRNT